MYWMIVVDFNFQRILLCHLRNLSTSHNKPTY